ncbi:MAG: tetratricopeptide repeat protein [Planctomycetes bacterium]|nr:tetratricopeptide repeat protein [Planctomycetota bacterium]
MTRFLAFALAIAFAVPLCANGLVHNVFEQKIADDWYTHFQQWVETTCESDGFIDTQFAVDESVDNFRVTSVEDGKLTAVRLSLKDGKREATGQPAKFEWTQWHARHMAVVYPVATSDNDQDSVAFAVWLYVRAEEPMLGNRVLTVIHERTPALQDDIAQYVREKHQWDAKDKLQVAEVWDDEFRVWRRVLLPRKTADALAKQRKTDEKDGIEKLLGEYANPEQRTLTLEQIEYSITIWLGKFDGSDTHKKLDDKINQALAAINKDHARIQTFLDLAQGLVQSDKDWDKSAEDFEKALALDPCSPLLLSKAANAWQRHANPEVIGGRFKCTQEHSARRAIELYHRWLSREPANMKVLLNKGVCHHVVGQRDDAAKCYKRVIAESTDDALIKLARDYDKLP